MKKLVILVSSLLLLVSVAGASLNCGDNGDETKYSWKLATYSFTGTLQTNMLQEFADKVKADSDGRLEITVYPDGSLYTMTQIFDAVSNRSIDMGYTGVTSYIGKAPVTAAVSTYTNTVAKNLDELVALNTIMSNEYEPFITEANRFNVTHLLWGPLGSQVFFTKFPVNTPADLAGKTLGSSKGVVPITKILGAVGQEMDLANFYLAAQNNQVDGWMLSPLENYESMKLYEVAKYMTHLQFNAIMSLLMNQDSFDALPADIQKIVTDNALAIQTKWVGQVAASDEAVVTRLKAISGVNIKVLTPTERAEYFNKAFIPVFTGMMKSVGMPEAQITEAKGIINRIQTTGK